VTSRHFVRGRNPDDGTPIIIGVGEGLITSIEQSDHNDGAWIAPGLVDLQVNGFGGNDLNSDSLSPDTVIELTEMLLANGVIRYLPTIITASEEKVNSALQAIVEARRRSDLVAYMIPSVHLEGPHISSEDGFRGAHPAHSVRPPDLAEFDRLQRTAAGLIGLVTLSPHYPEAPSYVAALVERGVHVAIGHTHASHAQILAAVDAGARLSTHLGNGISAQLPRHPNAIWTQLSEERLAASFIADGHHLPAETLKTMVRAKGIDRSILVSDAVALAGMPSGSYDTPIGGRVHLDANGKLTLGDTEFLAGSAVPLKDMVPRAMAMCGITLSQALRMASSNPGSFIGMNCLIENGAPADLICFTLSPDLKAMNIKTVMIRGESLV
jgi:N-acetylglucosamine-6-phosphate deacetylase